MSVLTHDQVVCRQAYPMMALYSIPVSYQGRRHVAETAPHARISLTLLSPS